MRQREARMREKGMIHETILLETKMIAVDLSTIRENAFGGKKLHCSFS